MTFDTFALARPYAPLRAAGQLVYRAAHLVHLELVLGQFQHAPLAGGHDYLVATQLVSAAHRHVGAR